MVSSPFPTAAAGTADNDAGDGSVESEVEDEGKGRKGAVVTVVMGSGGGPGRRALKDCCEACISWSFYSGVTRVLQ
jgi:hypothetical protein